MSANPDGLQRQSGQQLWPAAHSPVPAVRPASGCDPFHRRSSACEEAGWYIGREQPEASELGVRRLPSHLLWTVTPNSSGKCPVGRQCGYCKADPCPGSPCCVCV